MSDEAAPKANSRACRSGSCGFELASLAVDMSTPSSDVRARKTGRQEAIRLEVEDRRQALLDAAQSLASESPGPNLSFSQVSVSSRGCGIRLP